MKRATFKKPFNGKDNALKVIPESYKVDGNVFEITDGNESYRVRWEGSLNEGKGEILMASNQTLINEDMAKIKHLMGFNSKETLGNLKGEERINENASFKNVWDKTKSLLKENVEESEVSEDVNEDEVAEETVSETEVSETEVAEEVSEEVTEDINENRAAGSMGFSNEGNIEEMGGENLPDVQSVLDYIQQNKTLLAKFGKMNTYKEKLQGVMAFANAILGDEDTLFRKAGNQLLKMAGDAGEDATADVAQQGMDAQVGLSESESTEEVDEFDRIFEGMYEVEEEVSEATTDLKGDQDELDVEPEGGDGDIDAKDLEKLRDEK